MAIEELVDESERREHPRYAVNIPIDVQVGSEVVNGLMVDISIEGLRISIPKLIKPSTDIAVTFSTREKVIILSRTVWTLEKNTAGLPAYLIGLKIYTIQAGSRDVQGMAERTAFLQDLLS